MGQLARHLIRYSCAMLRRRRLLTCVENKGVAEGVVSVIAAVDQELCGRDDGAAVPAATGTHTHTPTMVITLDEMSQNTVISGL